ncbi:unnamed protein product [Meloidogyne enterolobii]|uniref:Uncharacterized protein n=1 Tax=Meloidogyne enterolobii TaxID=390850 RepID=A0ACB1AQG4_MELEN
MSESFPPLFNNYFNTSLETLNFSSNFKENCCPVSSSRTNDFKICNNIPIQRQRTKSLDNGTCFSLATSLHNNRKNPIRQITNSTNILTSSTTSILTKTRAISEKREFIENTKINLFNYPRLEQAKQFIKRFYNSTTNLKLKKKKRKEKINEQKLRMYGSAVGPFFEFRKPCQEELPLLPYNIHYKIDSSPESSNHSNSFYIKENEHQIPPTSNHLNSQLVNNQNSKKLFSHKFQLQQNNHPNNTSSPSTSSFNSFTINSPFSSISENKNRLTLPIKQLNSQTKINSFPLISESPDSAFGDSIDITPNNNNNFMNWTELFDYLRKEIVEMNVKDTQILHNLEEIQNELEDILYLFKK